MRNVVIRCTGKAADEPTEQGGTIVILRRETGPERMNVRILIPVAVHVLLQRPRDH